MARAKRSAEAAKKMVETKAAARAIRRYLEMLETTTSVPGRRRHSVEWIEKRLGAIDDAIPFTDDPLKRVRLYQEAERLTTELEAESLPEAEEGFVEVLKAYAEGQGIGYGAWRAVGVPAGVLKRAGLSQAYRGF